MAQNKIPAENISKIWIPLRQGLSEVEGSGTMDDVIKSKSEEIIAEYDFTCGLAEYFGRDKCKHLLFSIIKNNFGCLEITLDV